VASKTPREIVMRLADATAKVVASPDFRERIINAGMEPVANTPEQMLQVAKIDATKIEKIVRTAGIKLE
jgi:tripartite-type tricarboxylate transporter receptor subunit TctC